jgi:hypothetical protein
VSGDWEARKFKSRKAQTARVCVIGCCASDGGNGGCDQEQSFHDDTPLGLEKFPPQIPYPPYPWLLAHDVSQFTKFSCANLLANIALLGKRRRYAIGQTKKIFVGFFFVSLDTLL